MRYIDLNAVRTQVFDELRESLRASGSLRPTEGLTKPTADTRKFASLSQYTKHLGDEMRKYNSRNPFEDQMNEQYRNRRFDFIAAEEGFRSRVYKDINGYKTIGYGFNLDAPGNRELFAQVLGDDVFEAVYTGKREISKTEARQLFDAAVEQAERVVDSKFKGVPLKEHQRLALVSLAYNNPSLIGPNLTRQITEGDFDAARDEILYRSNRNKVRGLASRRYREAELFAGYFYNELPDFEEYMSQFS